jgi:transcriptional regulator with XRE-family HTH domain
MDSEYVTPPPDQAAADDSVDEPLADFLDLVDDTVAEHISDNEIERRLRRLTRGSDRAEAGHSPKAMRNIPSTIEATLPTAAGTTRQAASNADLARPTHIAVAAGQWSPEVARSQATSSTSNQLLEGDASSGDLRSYRRGTPTVLRMLLGARLRALREARGVSAVEAADTIRASVSKISRMEAGKVDLDERDVTDLLRLYGVTDSGALAATVSLTRDANKADWWHRYSDVLPDWFEVYISLEAAASLIRTYEVQFVPGLLQVEDYARAVIKLGFPDAREDELEQRVGLRMARQKCLFEAAAPRLWAVVDEAVLRRPLGGTRAMRAQLKHLIEVTELPNVTMQVIPFTAGGHAAAGGAFTILRFAEPALPDVVYLEQLGSALYLDKPHTVQAYSDVMNRLCIEAIPATSTPVLLTAILNDL